MTSHRIIIEAPSAHETIATMAALAAPHVMLNQIHRAGGVAVHGSSAPAPVVEPEKPAAPIGTGGVDAPAAATGEVANRRGRGRPRKDQATQPAVEQRNTVPLFVVTPTGETKKYETSGEALEAMADMLDLCSSVEAIDEFKTKNLDLLNNADGAAAQAFADMADELKQSMLDAAKGAERITDDLPITDTVGAEKLQKPAEATPPEMALDPGPQPDFLKNKKPVEAPDIRNAFLAMCKAKGAPAGRALLDGWQVARVSEVKPESFAEFVDQCRKASELDDAAWAAAVVAASKLGPAK